MKKRKVLLFAFACLLLCGCGSRVSGIQPATSAPTATPAVQTPVPTPAETEKPAPASAQPPAATAGIPEEHLSPAEQEFAESLKAQLLADGYEALDISEYVQRCRQPLLSPDALPDSYRSAGWIFLKPDPKVSSQTMVTQLWFDEESQEYLQFTQEDSELWVEESMRYQTREDSLEGAFNYRGVYKIRANDLAVTGVLYLSEDKGEEYCRGVLSSFHFDKR